MPKEMPQGSRQVCVDASHSVQLPEIVFSEDFWSFTEQSFVYVEFHLVSDIDS